jgi:hypothetical protein
MLNDVCDLWEAIKELLPPLLKIIAFPIIIILRILYAIIPIKQIYVAKQAVYLTNEELKELDLFEVPWEKRAGYYSKKSIAIRKQALQEAANA